MTCNWTGFGGNCPSSMAPSTCFRVLRLNWRKTTWGTDIWEEVWRATLVPAHLQIESILLSKIDLLDEQDIPKSYLDFIKHSQFNRAYIAREGYGGQTKAADL